jgi:hypothetical protein
MTIIKSICVNCEPRLTGRTARLVVDVRQREAKLCDVAWAAPNEYVGTTRI